MSFRPVKLLKALLLAAAAIAVPACAQTPEQPVPLQHSAPASPPEPSTIAIPLRLSLPTVAQIAEKGVPVTSKGRDRERGFDIEWKTKRTPLKFRMIGRGLHTNTSILYGVEACAGPLPCLTCGMGKVPRRVDVALQSVFEWTPAWRMKSRTTPLPPSFPLACEITPLRLDITQRFVAPVVREQLKKAAAEIDSTIAREGDMRARAQKAWSSLQQPTLIAPRTWLVLDPRAVSLSPIGGDGDVIGATLTVTALTRIEIGERPAVSTRPLPPLHVAPAPVSNIRIPVDVNLPWSEATRVVSEQLAGKTIQTSGTTLKIESITLLPGNGTTVRADAKVNYRAGLLSRFNGTIAFEGTPQLSPDGTFLTFPDLDFVLGSDAGFLARTADRFSHDSLRDRLRQSIRIDLAPQIAAVRSELTAGLQRELTKGVRMSGRVDTISVTALSTTANGIALRVLATGAAEVRM